MDQDLNDGEVRFEAYVEALSEAVGHVGRAGPLKDYCTGLLLPCERKSVEPMAAVVAPARVAAKHQSLLHLVGQGAWSDEAVLRKVRDLVLPAMQRQAPIAAWIVDDTGFAKKGGASQGPRQAKLGGVAAEGCIRSGWRANIAAVSANKTIARSR